MTPSSSRPLHDGLLQRYGRATHTGRAGRRQRFGIPATADFTSGTGADDGDFFFDVESGEFARFEA